MAPTPDHIPGPDHVRQHDRATDLPRAGLGGIRATTDMVYPVFEEFPLVQPLSCCASFWGGGCSGTEEEGSRMPVEHAPALVSRAVWS